MKDHWIVVDKNVEKRYDKLEDVFKDGYGGGRLDGENGADLVDQRGMICHLYDNCGFLARANEETAVLRKRGSITPDHDREWVMSVGEEKTEYSMLGDIFADGFSGGILTAEYGIQMKDAAGRSRYVENKAVGDTKHKALMESIYLDSVFRDAWSGALEGLGADDEQIAESYRVMTETDEYKDLMQNLKEGLEQAKSNGKDWSDDGYELSENGYKLFEGAAREMVAEAAETFYMDNIQRGHSR